MTHVKVDIIPQKEDLCDSAEVRDTDHASGVFLDKEKKKDFSPGWDLKGAKGKQMLCKTMSL